MAAAARGPRARGVRRTRRGAGPRRRGSGGARGRGRGRMTLYDHGLGAPAQRVPVDQEARHRVRSDLARNLFVEAGAGTGKTKVLVDRVVRLVATGTVSDISRLVAITFTEAAAAELRDRIRTELEQAAAEVSLPDD